jgi:hypothetical protein
METRQIIAELDKEITLLQTVRALLSGSSNKVRVTSKRRTLSPEARKKIADAQKKRWAKAKKAAKHS